MTNTEELSRAIHRSGIKFRYIAWTMGISCISLRLKLHNVTPFRVSEIEMLCAIVGITTRADKERLFFCG